MGVNSGAIVREMSKLVGGGGGGKPGIAQAEARMFLRSRRRWRRAWRW